MNIFIDTNIYLSFYHYTNDDLEEIKKLIVLIEKKEITLWLTDQVKDEFKRNRENKISDALKKLKEQKINPQFPQICKDYEEYNEIRDHQKMYSQKLSILTDKLTDDIIGHSLKADEKIKELFEKANIIETTKEIVEKARMRMDVRNPPGKNHSLGDAINWEGLLESVENNKRIYIIADDKDYFSELDKYKLKDFLANEWREKKSEGAIIYRRLSQFFNEHYSDIKLASELEKDLAIRNLVNSKNFHTTHKAINVLNKYTEFTASQIIELRQACINNEQVRWIISDKDVKKFYRALLKNHSKSIEKNQKEKIEKILS